MKTHLDWSAYDSYGIGDAYSGIPATGGNYAKAVAVCMNNRQCQREGKGVLGPRYRPSGDEAHSTQARVRAFKAALNGELGDEPFASPVLAEAMDLCVSCKGCKKECPSAVDMTLIKTEYLAQRNEHQGLPLRARLFAELPRWLHRQPRLLARLVQWHNRIPWFARLGETLLGISARRRIAEPAPTPYRALSSNVAPSPRGDVLLFADCFARHFEPEIASAAHAVLSAAGYRVIALTPDPGDADPTRPLCCGRTYLAAGMVTEAKVEARRVMAAVRPYLDRGVPIVGLEPSCLLALRDEFYSLGLGGDVVQLSKLAFLFEEFLMCEANKGMTLPLAPLAGGKALVHGHCHQKAFGGLKSLKKVLGMIPGFEFEILDATCCGMAGGFGLEAEHYDASQAMGELGLLPAVRNAAAGTTIIADGFSCRHQIKDGSGRRAEHVAVLLARHLAPPDIR